MTCPSHRYFKLVEGALVCEVCGQPPQVPTETPPAKRQAGKAKKD